MGDVFVALFSWILVHWWARLSEVSAEALVLFASEGQDRGVLFGCCCLFKVCSLGLRLLVKYLLCLAQYSAQGSRSPVTLSLTSGGHVLWSRRWLLSDMALCCCGPAWALLLWIQS